jgi:hypothetical protein
MRFLLLSMPGGKCIPLYKCIEDAGSTPMPTSTLLRAAPWLLTEKTLRWRRSAAWSPTRSAYIETIFFVQVATKLLLQS